MSEPLFFHHDDLCPEIIDPGGPEECRCALIAAVREDEREKALADLADAVDAAEVEAFWRGVRSGESAAATRASTADEATDKAVALLKSIGLDITYTDEGLRVVAEQIGRAYRADERAAIRERVEAGRRAGALEATEAILAAIDALEKP